MTDATLVVSHRPAGTTTAAERSASRLTNEYELELVMVDGRWRVDAFSEE